jgi:uncharacterized protein YndB with AHSA1/START domain
VSRQVSYSIVVDADPSTIFDVLADPSQHPLFDGSDSVKGRIGGPPRLYLGATFSMRMHWGAPYVITNTVTEYDEDRRIAWRHFARHVWRYELTQQSDHNAPRTEVTETFDCRPAPQRLRVLVESRVVTPR